MKNFIILKEDNDNDRTTEDDMFSNLSFKEKIFFFFLLSCIGYLIEFGSLSRFFKSIKNYDPKKFVILYSLGNIITIFSIVIFTGWKKQIIIMSNPTRRQITIIFIISIILSIIFSLTLNNKLGKILIIITVIIQFCSYWWYSLSFIPFGRTIFKKCFNTYILEDN